MPCCTLASASMVLRPSFVFSRRVISSWKSCFCRCALPRTTLLCLSQILTSRPGIPLCHKDRRSNHKREGEYLVHRYLIHVKVALLCALIHHGDSGFSSNPKLSTVNKVLHQGLQVRTTVMIQMLSAHSTLRCSLGQPNRQSIILDQVLSKTLQLTKANLSPTSVSTPPRCLVWYTSSTRN